MKLAQTIRQRSRALKRDVLALGLAVRHPGTPWYARLLVAALVVYVVTPVDFVPDVIPVLGVIDDLLFIPLALAIAMRLVPPPVLADCRTRAAQVMEGAAMRRATRLGALALWLALVTTVGILAYYAA